MTSSDRRASGEPQARWGVAALFDRAAVTPLGGPLPHGHVHAITDDSRQVAPGTMFVAVRGEKVDGHDFIPQAAAAGGSFVVAEREAQLRIGSPIIRVADSREALARLAAAFFGMRAGDTPLRLIGITGTNGKTTVAWLLRSILQAAGRRVALLGTIEYDLPGGKRKASLTTPGAVETCRHLAAAKSGGAEYAVMEVSSHALAQRRCDGLAFRAGIFTNISGDHLDYHSTMDAYATAKRRLFDLLEPDGVAVVNVDDSVGAEIAASACGRCVTYALDNPADLTTTVGECNLTGTSFELHGAADGVSVRMAIRWSMIGSHNVSNALAAAATALAVGIPPAAIEEGLARITTIPGRLERALPPGGNSDAFSVFVDYAHTDAALTNVLAALRPLTPGRLICVFGCGGDRDRTKRPRMAAAVDAGADLAFVTSDNPRTEDPREIIDGILSGFGKGVKGRVIVEPDRRRAIQAAINEARPGDCVLVAGKGHEAVQIVGDRELPFDDVAVARECLAAAGGSPAAAAPAVVTGAAGKFRDPSPSRHAP